MGKTLPAFPTHAQLAILFIGQEAHAATDSDSACIPMQNLIHVSDQV